MAVNADGSAIVGPSLEELVIDNGTTTTGRLTYPAATLDTAQATLTVRARYGDAPRPLDAGAWEVRRPADHPLLPAGTAFRQGSLYHLTYPATGPLVAGLGFAAVRDVVSFMRHAAADESRHAESARRAHPPRLLVRHLAAGALHARLRPPRVQRRRGRPARVRRRAELDWRRSGAFVNYRFAQPHRTQRQHIARWFPERPFPFAYNVVRDAVTGRTDGRLRRCLDNGTCPRILEANSSNEYWVKASSLLHTDTLGDDLPDPANVRLYLFSSFPHSGGSRQRGNGICQQPRNTLEAEPVLRALLVALDEWVSAGTEPPASRVPRRADGTLVEALPREHLGFPAIPGVHYDGLLSTGDLLDFGPHAGDGILGVLPPGVTEPYPRAGAAHRRRRATTWPASACRTSPRRWRRTRAGRCAPPRTPATTCATPPASSSPSPGRGPSAWPAATRGPSVEERYGGRDGYVEAVERATRALRQERLLLAEDAERIIAAAQARSLD